MRMFAFYAFNRVDIAWKSECLPECPSERGLGELVRPLLLFSLANLLIRLQDRPSPAFRSPFHHQSSSISKPANPFQTRQLRPQNTFSRIAMQRSTTFVLFASAVVLSVLPAATAFQKGSQNRVMWENDCDFYGKDQRAVRGVPDVCGDLCANDYTCSHWTWTNYNGGTCWLKKGSSNTKLKKYGAVCGYVISRFTLSGASVNQVAPVPAPAPAPVSNNGLNVVENQAMLNSVNAYRQQNGLGSLRIDSHLNAASSAHSQDQASRCMMTHDGANGSKAWDRMAQQGYSWGAAAENVAAGQNSVDQVMNSWWNSPGHRANILNADVKDVGFGKAVNNGCGNYKTYWTQDFGKTA